MNISVTSDLKTSNPLLGALNVLRRMKSESDSKIQEYAIKHFDNQSVRPHYTK